MIVNWVIGESGNWVIACAARRPSSRSIKLPDYQITQFSNFMVVPSCDLLYCSWRVAKGDSKPASRRRSSQPKRTAQAKRVGRLLVVFFAIVLIVDGLIGDRGLVA